MEKRKKERENYNFPGAWKWKYIWIMKMKISLECESVLEDENYIFFKYFWAVCTFAIIFKTNLHRLFGLHQGGLFPPRGTPLKYIDGHKTNPEICSLLHCDGPICWSGSCLNPLLKSFKVWKCVPDVILQQFLVDFRQIAQHISSKSSYISAHWIHPFQVWNWPFGILLSFQSCSLLLEQGRLQI